jgi:hypothetical protein
MAGTPRQRPTSDRPTRRKPAAPPPQETPYELPEHAVDFGLRIEELTLPDEDPAPLRVELNRWYAFYRARSPIAIACIGWAFLAWVRLRRLSRCEEAIQTGAIRKGEEHWDDAQDEVVEKYKRMLATAPAEAIRGLEGFAAGCRWLINRWQRLEGLLEKDGYWGAHDRDEAICLLGAEPVLERLHDSRGAYLTWLYCALSQPNPEEDDIMALAAPERIPPTLRESMDFTRLPGPAGCREWFHKLIDQVLSRLRQREESLWVKVEEPGRSQAIARELAEVERSLKSAATQKRHWQQSLQRNLKMVAQESKLAGIAIPRGLPYESTT